MPTGLTPTEGVGGAVAYSPRPPHGTDGPRWETEVTEQSGTPIIRLARRHALLVAACAIVAGGAGMFVTARLPRQYEATVSIRVDQKASQATAIGAANFSRDNGLGTEVEMLRSRELALAVVDSLGLRLTVEKLGSGADKPVPRSMVLSAVRVRGDAPKMWYQLVRGRTIGSSFRIRRATPSRFPPPAKRSVWTAPCFVSLPRRRLRPAQAGGPHRGRRRRPASQIGESWTQEPRGRPHRRTGSWQRSGIGA